MREAAWARSASCETIRRTVPRLQAAETADIFDELDVAHPVLILQPTRLALVAGQHTLLQLERFGNIDVVLGDKVDARQGVHVVDLRDRLAGRVLGLDVRHRRHHADVPASRRRAVVGVIVGGGVGEDHVGRA